MNKYNRIFNFAAGPAMLPEEVLETAKIQECLLWKLVIDPPYLMI